ncbi:helix-turn-helix domain-containing protein [Sphaerisporangium sp. NPDC049003]|uniref:AlbA family DNA-binding domain-containing protein n=1 Tax=Sphaerisporangium sp. NPDC049003 TaxID=3364517 RepID=UPI00371B3C6B
MSSTFSQPHQTTADYQDRISQQAFEQLVSVRGEGDEWDFKATLGDITSTSVRVNLAKDALAFCNLPGGGTIIAGVTDDYDHVGLADSERIDTTIIRRAIEKYIDGDFIVVAAEHTLAAPGTSEAKRYGMIHFRRRFAQPVLAALDGQITNDRQPLFRSGDILIRRGAASIRANSGDVRRLFTNSIVHEERVRAVNELWKCLVEQRRLMGGVEFLYDVLTDTEYPEAITRPSLRDALGHLTSGRHADDVDRLQLRVSLVRPHIPEMLHQQYRACAAFVGRLHMKAIRQRDAGVFAPWTELDNGSPDLPLRQLALELIPQDELNSYWTGRATDLGTHRPVRPVIDAAERGVLSGIHLVLNGLG